MNHDLVQSRQSLEEITNFLEIQAVQSRTGDKVTCDIDDLANAVRTLCAYERAIAEGENAALRARMAQLEAALQPAWEALEGATPGNWQVEHASSWAMGRREIVEWFVRLDGDDVAIASEIIDPRNDDQPSEANARAIASAVNAVRATRPA